MQKFNFTEFFFTRLAFKSQEGHRRLTVFRLDALAGSLLTRLQL